MNQAPDDLKASLLNAVKQHYTTSRRPLFVAKLGQLVADRPHGGSLLDFVRNHLADEYVVLTDPHHPNVSAVVPVLEVEHFRSLFTERTPSQTTVLNRVPRVLLVAFCKSIADDKIMFFRAQPPYRYEVATSSPGPDYVAVESDLRVPGHIVTAVSQLPVEVRTRLEANIETWLRRHDITFEPLPRRSVPTTQVLGTALQRLIDAQAPEMRSRVFIPADIAEILLKF